MFNQNFNIPGNKPVVLVAPLDWGLGHATRCIPIVSELTNNGCIVLIAAEGQIKNLLQTEFPELRFLDLKGYRIKYSRSKYLMPVKMLLQLPKILYRIYAENRWLKKAVIDHKINAVIADNRMGLYHKKIPCIYITHQLCIKTGNRFTEFLAQKIHYHYINKFKACWVPDEKGVHNLAGDLSHPQQLPNIAVTYLGPLSRFERSEEPEKYDLSVILSGPEPQRTIFENLAISALEHMPEKTCLIRGLPGKSQMLLLKNHSVSIKNHMPAEELKQVIQQSGMVITRCGYSSVMDLVKLGKKAILVPTPGQTEQQYLAEYLKAKNLFYTVEQSSFSLSAALQAAASFEYKTVALGDSAYKSVLKGFVAILSNQ